MTTEQRAVSENSDRTAVRGRPFQPGQVANPKGRPKKGNAIKDILKSVPVSDKRALVKVAYEEALKGNAQWAEWIVKHSGESGSGENANGPMREIIIREYGGFNIEELE